MYGDGEMATARKVKWFAVSKSKSIKHGHTMYKSKSCTDITLFMHPSWAALYLSIVRDRRLGSEGGRHVLRPVSWQFCPYLHKLRFINETLRFWNSGHAFHYFYEWCFLKKTSIKYYNNCLSWKVNVFLEKKFTGTILYKQHQIMKNDFSSRE